MAVTIKSRILIVEDDSNVRKMIRVALGDQIREVIETSNAEDGFQMALTFCPEIALLDIGLSGKMSGLELGEMLKQQFREVHIVFISGSSDDHHVERASEVGADIYFVKPFSPRRLVELVSTIEAQLRRAFIVPPDVKENSAVPIVTTH